MTDRACIWITRTEPAASQTAQIVRGMGFDTIVEPLIDIVAAENFQMASLTSDLIFTSGHAVRFFCQRTERRDWQVWTVGDKTAALARQKGFAHVQSASGTVETLKAMLQELAHDTRQNRFFTHISGEQTRGNLAQELCQTGIKAERRIIYSQKPRTVRSDFPYEDVTHVLLYSPKTAQLFRLYSSRLGQVNIYCISPATRDELMQIDQENDSEHKILVAAEPTEAALLSLLPRS